MIQLDSFVTERFFGRTEVLDKLKKRIQAFEKGYRQNVCLIGRPFIGKTSIIRRFLHVLASSSATLPIYIALEEHDSFRIFAYKWMGSILHSYRRSQNNLSAFSYPAVLRHIKQTHPALLKQLRTAKEFLNRGKNDHCYQELLRTVQILGAELNRKVLLVIDEFHQLESLKLRDPFAKLGKEIMMQNETMFIVTSSHSAHASEIIKEKLVLLFSNFEISKVDTLNFEEAKSWFETRLDPECQTNKVKQTLLSMTGGHPYYLDILLTHFSAQFLMKPFPINPEELLIDVLETDLWEDDGMINQSFSTRFQSLAQNRGGISFEEVLISVALGKKKISTLARYLQQPIGEIKKILQRLVAEDFIQKMGSFYSIQDTLFRFWLKEVCYRKQTLLGWETRSDQETFRNAVRRYMERAVQEEAKDLPLKIESLFKKFHNEVIDLGNRKIVCPKFEEIASKPSNGRMFPVLAKSSNTNWLCQVVKDELDEEDVRLFLADVKKVDRKIQRRLLIVLKGMELNAKLLATESDVQLWNLNDLNVILDLYDQAKVIL